MSFLFDKKTQKTMKWVWIFFSVIIIISMTFLFSGGSGIFSGAPSPSESGRSVPR